VSGFKYEVHQQNYKDKTEYVKIIEIEEIPYLFGRRVVVLPDRRRPSFYIALQIRIRMRGMAARIGGWLWGITLALLYKIYFAFNGVYLFQPES
jgi:hypothetical protein